MNAFETHKNIVNKYREYLRSFVYIDDPHIKMAVDLEMEDPQKLIPDPLINFNPDYEPGGTTDELIKAGLFHKELQNVFPSYSLYTHQVSAIELGTEGKSFVVTSGTGSGKSLTYLGTVFDYLFKQPVQPKGVVALLVYPMNALINSQEEEIKKYAQTYRKQTGKEFPITFGRYTGQEGTDAREQWKNEPPQLLLTNYMMLELIMTRKSESAISDAINSNLRFLAFDEMHTYRGRQGADVAMLIRRIRAQATHRDTMICMGTSATIASDSEEKSTEAAVADVAREFFGVPFAAEQVVLETLTRSFDEHAPSAADLTAAVSDLAAGIDSLSDERGEDALKSNDLARWLEQNISLETDKRERTDKPERLVRGKPITLVDIAEKLRKACGNNFAKDDALEALQNLLNWAMDINQRISQRKPRKTYLPHRLHQFVQQTGSVFVTLESPETRHIQFEDQNNFSKDGKETMPLYQTVFSRLTGVPFLCVTYNKQNGQLVPRRFEKWLQVEEEDETTDSSKNSKDDPDKPQPGYIILQPAGAGDLWTKEDEDYLPPTWSKKKKDELVLKDDKRARLPKRIYCNAQGDFRSTPSIGFLEAWFVGFPLQIDPSCNAVYEQANKRSSEIVALIGIGIDARSTANTLLSYLIVQEQWMNNPSSRTSRSKVLCFIDFRQDASLQSGHFNDFIRTVAIRSALLQAIRNTPADEPVRLENIGRRIFKTLDFPVWRYGDNLQEGEEVLGSQLDLYEADFQRMLFYIAIRDLRLGWRVNLPNLEQTDQIRIEYQSLEKDLKNDELIKAVAICFSILEWEKHREDIQGVIRNTIDFFRRSFAINYKEYDKLVESFQFDKLNDHWGADDGERAEKPAAMYVDKPKDIKKRLHVTLKSMGSTSAYGRYFRGVYQKMSGTIIDAKNYKLVIDDFLKIMKTYGFLYKTEIPLGKAVPPLYVYQLRGELIQWTLGEESRPYHDDMRLQLDMRNHELPPPNPFFIDLYKTDVHDVLRLSSAEHTGQINNADRQEREIDFRTGKLNVLYCSPTMELGIDIADLSVVQMRNVPPNPANYAQRSGRAGRSGQAALVFTYCSRYSAHDQHYFSNKEAMVAGIVKPPVFDFTNEELYLTHLHALCLPFLQFDFSNSVIELIDETIKEKGKKTFPLYPDVYSRLAELTKHEKQIRSNFEFMIEDQRERLLNADYVTWFKSEWFKDKMNAFPKSFEQSFDRWRDLYRRTEELFETAKRIIDDVTIPESAPEKKEALGSRRFAQKQIDLLGNKQQTYGNQIASSLSEFYPYRYLASEGFLPGYNFTRRPINLSLRKRGKDAPEYIDRPRFVAIRESGPQNHFYHNGRKYQVTSFLWNPDDKPLQAFKILRSTGQLLTASEKSVNNCPLTEEDVTQASNYEIVPNVVEFGLSVASVRDRITCGEEERQRNGYEIRVAFGMDSGVDLRTFQALTPEKEELATIHFLPSARIYQINMGWTKDKVKQTDDAHSVGFWIDTEKSGAWLSENKLAQRRSEIVKISQKEILQNIRPYVDRTADAILIRPQPALELNGRPEVDRRTLMYAFLKGLELYFSIEPREIAGDLVGDNQLLIYENAEGSMGLLRQLAQSPKEFQAVFTQAIEICHFNTGDSEDPDNRKSFGDASYHDLLDFSNQRFHMQIDRFDIKKALYQLQVADFQPLYGKNNQNNREEQYQYLLRKIDPDSIGEKRFLEYVMKMDYRLPDDAQRLEEACSVRPDFTYLSPNHVAVFIDGKPHDQPKTQEADRQKRGCLKNLGIAVRVSYYMNDLGDFFEDNPKLK